jgi:hypothetical protein
MEPTQERNSYRLHPDAVGDVRGITAYIAQDILDARDDGRPVAAIVRSLRTACG